MRWCWNWQTGMVEGHVPQGVRVRLPPSALSDRSLLGSDFSYVNAPEQSLFFELEAPLEGTDCDREEQGHRQVKVGGHIECLNHPEGTGAPQAAQLGELITNKSDT